MAYDYPISGYNYRNQGHHVREDFFSPSGSLPGRRATSINENVESSYSKGLKKVKSIALAAARLFGLMGIFFISFGIGSLLGERLVKLVDPGVLIIFPGLGIAVMKVGLVALAIGLGSLLLVGIITKLQKINLIYEQKVALEKKVKAEQEKAKAEDKKRAENAAAGIASDCTICSISTLDNVNPIIRRPGCYTNCAMNNPMHEKCLRTWLAKNNTCPVCTAPTPLMYPDSPLAFRAQQYAV